MNERAYDSLNDFMAGVERRNPGETEFIRQFMKCLKIFFPL